MYQSYIRIYNYINYLTIYVYVHIYVYVYIHRYPLTHKYGPDSGTLEDHNSEHITVYTKISQSENKRIPFKDPSWMRST